MCVVVDVAPGGGGGSVRVDVADGSGGGGGGGTSDVGVDDGTGGGGGGSSVGVGGMVIELTQSGACPRTAL